MNLTLNTIKKLIVVGDRVLVKPVEENQKTATGLFLPPGVAEKERVQSGYVVKVGPGYATGLNTEDEPWKEVKEQVKYIPLQAKEGDLVIFLKKDAYEIEFEKEKFLIIPQNAVLLIVRDDYL